MPVPQARPVSWDQRVKLGHQEVLDQREHRELQGSRVRLAHVDSPAHWEPPELQARQDRQDQQEPQDRGERMVSKASLVRMVYRVPKEMPVTLAQQDPPDSVVQMDLEFNRDQAVNQDQTVELEPLVSRDPMDSRGPRGSEEQMVLLVM